MYNLVLLAARPPEWTHEQFITWWRGDHAKLTCRLPGLRRWRHTERFETFMRQRDADPSVGEWTGWI